VGKNFTILGVPYLKIRGKASHITIGDDVFIGGDIDLRNRENGKIVFEDGVNMNGNCRFVAANDATLRIGKRTYIGRDCIFNAGSDLTVGQKSIFSSRIYINSSDHVIDGKNDVIDLGYSHDPIVIDEAVYIGGGVSIKMGVKIGKGAVIGANAVVTSDLPAYSVNVGIPAKTIRMRQEKI
jgi:acetyltransferase-like isoleucine patch superfamily enzyme